VKAVAGTDATFTYDANGNMTSDGTRTFEWDAENRLVSVTITATGHRSEFGYDGMGRRVCIRELDPQTQGSTTLAVTSNTKYLFDGVDVAESRTSDGGTVLQRFYQQGFVDSDGAILWSIAVLSG
jgi:YD repeat-containing protein